MARRKHKGPRQGTRQRGYTMRQRGSSWQCRVLDPITQKQSIVKSFPSEAQAEAWGDATVERKHQGLGAPSTKVADVMESLVSSLEQAGRDPDYVDRYRFVAKWMLEHKANDLAHPSFPDRIRHAISNHNASRNHQTTLVPASASTKNNFLTHINAMIRHAMARGWLDRNPLLGIVKRHRVSKKNKPIFTLLEIQHLLSNKAKGINAGWWIFTALGVYGGFRPSELRAITWSMVHWEEKRIVLPADLPGNKTKTERSVPLQAELMELLKPVAGVGRAPIVGNAIRQLHDSCATKHFQAWCEKVGVKAEPQRKSETEPSEQGRGPHTLRHCCSALLCATGMPLSTVQRYLGHESPQVALGYSKGAEAYLSEVQAAGWRVGELRVLDLCPEPVASVEASPSKAT